MKNVFGKYGPYSLLVILVLSVGVMCACNSPTGGIPNNPEVTPTIQNGIEVVYFHRSIRCDSCNYAEDTTRYTIETYFADELASGTLVFLTVNLQDADNAALVEKYGAYTSSLFINEVKDGVEHFEEVTDIWLLVGNDDAFVDLVKTEIEKRL